MLYCGVYLSLNHQLHGTVWIKSRQTTDWDSLLGLNTIKVEWEYLLQYGGLRRCLWLYWALVPYEACYVSRKDCSWSTVSFIWQCDTVTVWHCLSDVMTDRLVYICTVMTWTHLSVETWVSHLHPAARGGHSWGPAGRWWPEPAASPLHSHSWQDWAAHSIYTAHW